MHYDWMIPLVFLAGLIGLTKLGTYLAFRIPALAQQRDENRRRSKIREAELKEPWIVESGKRWGLALNATFIFGVLPFVTTLNSLPLWRYFADPIAMLMIFDFYYYLTHRFAFHGVGWLRRIHGVHHQALNPTHIDAFYVHPVETVIGILLFFAGLLSWPAIVGPVHVSSMIIAFLIFTELNTINHTTFELDRSPYRLIHYAVAKHHVHHVNMRKGNYATLTMVYDYLFRTLD